MKHTVHQRIVKAAIAGTGIRLNADEVYCLFCEKAIRMRASIDFERSQEHAQKLKPARTNLEQ